jgi:membrane protease YdiL (CAAX protease family)
MTTFDNKLNWSSKYPPAVGAVLLLFTAFFGFILIGPLLGLMLGLPFYDGDVTSYFNDMLSPAGFSTALKLPLFILQGTASFIGFILLPALFMVFYERQTVNAFFTNVKFSPKLLWLTPVIGLVFMGFNAFFIEWNAALELPSFLSEFEQAARAMEDRAMQMTLYLTTFDSFAMFILGFIVIAVIPGIGEELVFRGFLQNYFHRSSKNIHVAIWLSAFLFSAMHMQFYGFIPRVLLGALFGYLYYWSGNLIIPVLAHVFNNGFTIIMMYMNQLSITNIDVESTESIPISYMIIATLLTGGLIYVFRKTSFQYLQTNK